MIIKNVSLRDFRNYESLDLQLNSKVNIFLGDNAQGKTNIIEAIYLTSVGRSFRTRDDKDMIRFGTEYAGVSVSAERDDGDPVTCEISLSRNGRAAKVDGVKIRRSADLLGNIFAVVFSPEDLRIVKDDPEKRRHFADTEISRTSRIYYEDLSNYKRAVKQRNAYLKDTKYGGGNSDVLASWDDQLASYGARVMIKRAEFVASIDEISRRIHRDITGGKEYLRAEYEPSVPASPDFEEQKELILRALQRDLENDIRNCTTSAGPHRDDILISIDNIDIRKYGSQGQQRTAALSLKLAELALIKEEAGEEAVLLLDDVMSELDQSRQSFLISSLSNVQLFITTTELSDDILSGLPEGEIFRVSAGTVTRDDRV